MVDMHIHTNYSDGKDTVLEVLKKSQELKLKLISITDHNTVNAYKEIKYNNLKELFKGKIITGIEFKCHFNKQIIELLAYDFNVDKIDKFIENNYIEWGEINKKSTILFENLLIKNNIEYDKNVLINYDYSKYNGILKLYETVLKFSDNIERLKGDYYEDVTAFYNKCVCNVNSKFYIELYKFYPDIKDIVKLVKQNNGKIFVPHVFLFNNGGTDLLNELNNKKYIDGIECYHPSYKLEQINELLNYAKTHNLYISGGSDYHGNSFELGNCSEYYNSNNIKLF